MVKTVRRRKIVEMLLENSNGMTGEELASRLGVSSRTIRSDIKDIQKLLKDSDSSIIALPSKGYQLSTKENFEGLLNLIDDIKESSLGTVNDRQVFILERLLECSLQDKAITHMDLADETFTAISTFKSYLPGVKQLLAEYSLEIVQYKTDGVILRGDEYELRRCTVDRLLVSNNDKLKKVVFEKCDIDVIKDILHHTLSLENMKLTDTSRNKLCYQTALIIQRGFRKKNINYSASMAHRLEGTFEYSVAKEIIDKIFFRTGIDLSFSETYYLTQCLLLSTKLGTDENVIDESYENGLVDDILQVIKQTVELDFTEDQFLKDGLALHLRIAITRVQFNMSIRNELLVSTKKDYPLAFQISVIAAKVIKQKAFVEFNENEIGYIALHFAAALSRNSIKEKRECKNVGLVCSAGLGVSMLLRAKIEEYFQNRINIVWVVPAYEIKKVDLSSVEYILSTVSLDDVDSSILIKVNHMLRTDDIVRIEHIMFEKSGVSTETILGLFDKKNFYIDMDFSTKEECINFLADQGIKHGIMNEEIKQSIFEREEMSSTAIGDFAAVPHPIGTDQAMSSVSIMILNNPVMWGGMPVKVIFLLNINTGQASFWEKIFQKLYEYIKQKGGISSMLQHKSYDIFLKEYIALF